VSGAPDAPRVPQVTAPLVAHDREGAYHRLVFAAPEVAEQARPGQFVALAVGGAASATLLRRCFSIHRVDTRDGTVSLVVASNGPGTQWLTALAPSGAAVETAAVDTAAVDTAAVDTAAVDTAAVDMVGPLGRPFPLPQSPTGCVLVGGGYGSAPLFWLGERLQGAGCSVDLVLGAASADRLYGVDQAEALGGGVSLTTDDGSVGARGWVSDVLPGVIRRGGATVVYGCGPMAMLASVSGIAGAHGAVAHVAVEESMACGVGVCMTCVLAVVGEDGRTRMVRSCVEGPVFRGDRVRWDALGQGWGAVPDDAVGAPAPARGRVDR